jgi:large subunit ribosomal protein L22
MESKTYLKNLAVTPKKLRTLLPGVKKLTPQKAAEKLYYMPNKSARILYKAIKSAMTNAKHTLKVEDNLLKFSLLTIEEGNKLKRYNPGSRGSAKPYTKQFAHIKIILTAEVSPTVGNKEQMTKEAEEVEVTAPSQKEVAKVAKKAPKKANAEVEVKAEKEQKVTKKKTVKKTK